MIRIKKVYNKISLIALIMLSACSLDHNVKFNINNSGYSTNYIQIRDFDYMPYFNPSDLEKWSILDSTEEKLHYSRIFTYSEDFPSLFTINNVSDNEIINDSDYVYLISKNKEIVLTSPFKISKKNYFIFTRYELDGTFKGRNIKNNYDKLINYYSGFFEDAELIINGDNIVEDNNNNFDVIINQLLSFLYLETINKSNINFNQKSIYLNALKNWREDQKLKSLMSNDMTGLSQNQLKQIINAGEEFLYKSTNYESIEELQKNWRDLELEIYMSLLLLFNDFHIEISIIGEDIYHNADSSYNNTYYWDVDINKFLNSNYKIFAQSKIYNKKQIVLILSLVSMIIIVLIRKKIY